MSSERALTCQRYQTRPVLFFICRRTFSIIEVPCNSAYQPLKPIDNTVTPTSPRAFQSKTNKATNLILLRNIRCVLHNSTRYIAIMENDQQPPSNPPDAPDKEKMEQVGLRAVLMFP